MNAKLTFLLSLLIVTLSTAEARALTVGVIMDEDTPYYQSIHEAFVAKLKAARSDIEIFVQKPSASGLARANAARRLASLNVDVAITYGANTTAIVAKEAKDVPMVFAVVHSGGFRAPAETSTGVVWRAPLGRLVSWLESVKDFSSLGLVAAERDRDAAVTANGLGALSNHHNFKLKGFEARKPAHAAKISQVDAILLANSCVSKGCIDAAVAAARAAKAPSAATAWCGHPTGVLLSVSVDPAEFGTKAAQMALDVLAGKSPSEVPSSRATKVMVVVDLKEAKKLELTVPFELLSAATNVVR